MSAVRLNRRLILEAPQRLGDGAGGFTQAWIALGEVWADVRARAGREKAGEAVAISTVGYKIVVRGAPYGSDQRPQPDQRFREGARLFRILAVAERDPEGRYLTCFAEEEVAA